MTLVDETQPRKPGLRSKILSEYETLARLHGAQGPVLEIMHGPRQNALSLTPLFAGQERHVLVQGQSSETDGVQFHSGNPNDMADLFDDECFATVVWDRVLEHDPAFWLTLAEIYRVLKPGGILLVCTRAFAKSNKFGMKVTGANGNPIPFLTATSPVNATSADFWRISPQSMRKVILKNFEVREVRLSFMVPHLFGVGAKAA